MTLQNIPFIIVALSKTLNPNPTSLIFGGDSSIDFMLPGLELNNESSLVRKAIVEIGFHIVDELVFSDNHKTYDLIVADIGNEQYNELEIEFGPINLKEKPFFFIQRIEKEIAKLNKVLPHITTQSRKDEITARLKLLEEVIR